MQWANNNNNNFDASSLARSLAREWAKPRLIVRAKLLVSTICPRTNRWELIGLVDVTCPIDDDDAVASSSACAVIDDVPLVALDLMNCRLGSFGWWPELAKLKSSPASSSSLSLIVCRCRWCRSSTADRSAKPLSAADDRNDGLLSDSFGRWIRVAVAVAKLSILARIFASTSRSDRIESSFDAEILDAEIFDDNSRWPLKICKLSNRLSSWLSSIFALISEVNNLDDELGSWSASDFSR